MSVKGRKEVTPQEFCLMWQSCSTVKEVAEKLGVKESAVRSRANLYMKRGVKLKKFPKGVYVLRKPLPVDMLNKLIEQAAKNNGQEPEIEGTRLK